jgi:antitoxin HicB
MMRLSGVTKGQKMAKPADYLKLPYGRVVVPEEDGTFRAEIVEFPGCMATADSALEALGNLEEVAESWLQSMIDRGQSIPEPMDASGFSGKLDVSVHKIRYRLKRGVSGPVALEAAIEADRKHRGKR